MSFFNHLDLCFSGSRPFRNYFINEFVAKKVKKENRIKHPVFYYSLPITHCSLKSKSRLNQFRYRSRPSRLMRSTYTTSVVPMEIFKEGNIVSKVLIIIKLRISSIESRCPCSSFKKIEQSLLLIF
jgi:hypothetical protein